jgi:hypothetical protein
MELGVYLPGTFRGRKDFVLSGDLVQRVVREICKKTALETGISLSLGASLGNLEVGSFTVASVPVEALREETGGKTPLQGTLKDT